MSTEIDARFYFAVYGNCQSDPIARLLSENADFSSVFERFHIGYCFSITREDMAHWVEQYAPRLDILVAHNLRPLWRGDELFDVNFIRKRMPVDSKLITYFDIYYRGYSPEWVGPIAYGRPEFCGYVNLIAEVCYARGLKSEQILQFYTDRDTFDPMLVTSIHRLALHDMHMNELTTDIKVARFMEQNWRCSKLFLAYNHPSSRVLQYVADSVFKLLNVQNSSDGGSHREFLSDVRLPGPAAFDAILDVPTGVEMTLKTNVTDACGPGLMGFIERTLDYYDKIGVEKIQADIAMQRVRSPISYLIIEAVEGFLDRSRPIINLRQNAKFDPNDYAPI